MTAQLITLPVRVGLHGTRLMIRVAEGVSDRALGMTLRVAGTILGVRPQRRPEPPVPRPSPASTTPQPTRTPRSSTTPRSRTTAQSSTTPQASATPEAAAAREPAPPRARSRAVHGNGAGELASERLEREGLATAPPRTREETAPPHVSEEPELVLESAAPGAEEGAGASVTVREPWEGYARMNARTVISRLAQATKAELAAVELYERGHRGRRTVLDAVKRELRTPGR